MADILESCTEYLINVKQLDQNVLNNLIKDFGEDEFTNNDFVRLTGDIVEKYNINESAKDYDSVEFLDYLLEDMLECMIGKHPHYLVFAKNVTWNGNSGYKIVEDIKETCYRNYDISLYVTKEITNKAIICRESSHDVPLGSTTVIIGLSNEEYDKLKDVEFIDIEKFVGKFE